MAILSILRSFKIRVRKRLLPNRTSHEETDPQGGESQRPPSPIPELTETDLLSSVLKKLEELEEKVDDLQSKPSEMPSQKEEVLDAAVLRVDALEAELIATKEALHEAHMKQEELLAFIDRREDAKFRKKKFCFLR